VRNGRERSPLWKSTAETGRQNGFDRTVSSIGPSTTKTSTNIRRLYAQKLRSVVSHNHVDLPKFESGSRAVLRVRFNRSDAVVESCRTCQPVHPARTSTSGSTKTDSRHDRKQQTLHVASIRSDHERH